jgi:transposase-like protein
VLLASTITGRDGRGHPPPFHSTPNRSVPRFLLPPSRNAGRNELLEQENEILRQATAYFARDVLPK